MMEGNEQATTIERLAQFVLNRKTKNLRDELHEYLISVSLLESEEGLSLKEITDMITAKLGLSTFPDIIIKEGLTRLQEKEEIFSKKVSGETEKFILSENSKKNLLEYFTDYKTILKKIFESLFSKIEKKYGKLSREEEKKLKYAFIESFGQLLDKFGRNIASVFYKGKLGTLELLHIQNLEKILNNRLKELIDDDLLVKTTVDCVTYLLKNPSRDFSRFLFAISQSYYLIQILNLDPKCQKLLKTRLSAKNIYLDTNILIHLLFGEDKFKQSTKTELSLTKNLEFNLIVTDRTIKEFKLWLKEKKNYCETLEQVPIKRFQKTKDILEAGIVKEFLSKKQKQPSLTWDGFTAKYEKIGFILKENFDINIDTNFEKNIEKKKEEISNLIPIVQNYAFKSVEVAEHDAAHIIFIQELRDTRKIDAMGPNFWFLTHDSTLPFVEKEYHPEAIPSAILGYYWIMMISPFVAPDVSTQDSAIVFGRVFSSSLTSPNVLSEEQWLKIQGSWLDTEGLSPEIIEEIIGTKFVKDLFHERKTEEIKPEEITKAVDKAIVQKIRKGREEKQDMIKQHSQEIEKINEKIGEQQIKISKQQKEIEHIGETRRKNIEDIKKDKQIAFLAMLVVLSFSIIIDFVIFFISPTFWMMSYGIIITAEFSIFMIAFGMTEWLKRQIKKLTEVK